MKLVLLALAITLAALSVSGCARVKPWEREHLADPIMKFDADKEDRAVREHFLGTRERSAEASGSAEAGVGGMKRLGGSAATIRYGVLDF